MAEASTSDRRPYRGSCHCGHTNSTVRLRKCNCTTCHKMAYFHIRPMDSPNDFQLLSPSDPSQLSDYTCFDKRIHWYFCPKCGVRCFAFTGDSETKEVEVDGEKRTVWAPKAEGWDENTRGSYLSVNAQSLEPGQEGFNILEWTEKKWISYLDYYYMAGEPRLKGPYEGGTY